MHGMEYMTLLQAREGEGGEEVKWHPTSVTPLLVQVGSLAGTAID